MASTYSFLYKVNTIGIWIAQIMLHSKFKLSNYGTAILLMTGCIHNYDFGRAAVNNLLYKAEKLSIRLSAFFPHQTDNSAISTSIDVLA